MLQRVLRFREGIERQGRIVLRLLVPVVKPGIFFLQVAGVGKDDAAQIDRGRRGIDGTAESFPHQPRNPAAMVEVGVSQDDSVNAGRRHRRGLPVAQPPFLGSLEHAAIDEHLKSGFTAPVSRGVDQVL